MEVILGRRGEFWLCLSTRKLRWSFHSLEKSTCVESEEESYAFGASVGREDSHRVKGNREGAEGSYTHYV
jgi:hypothetical protein